jgi:hypothetical protein
LFPISGGNDFAFEDKDFTIEAWIYPRSNGGYDSKVFYDSRTRYFNPTRPVLYLTGFQQLTYNNGSDDVIYGHEVQLNKWSHVAVSRKNNKTKLFLNGTQTGNTYVDNNHYECSINRPIIGGSFDNSNFIGFIDDVRITKGIAKYTTNFVPSSTLYLDNYITGTVSNSAFFNNDSINYGTLTNAVFNGNSQNFGFVENAAVYYPRPYPLEGQYNNINYYGYVFGCDDSDADNYNPLVNTNDGSCTYSSIYPNNGIVAYWKLDEGSDTRYDSTTNANDLTSHGTVLSNSGKINDAAVFTNSWYDNYLYSDTFSIPPASDFTICGWILLNNSGFQEIISQWYGGYSGNFLISYGNDNSNKFYFKVKTTSGQVSPVKIEAEIGTWNFFAMRWKDGVKLEARINDGNWYTVYDTGNLADKGSTNFMLGAGESYGYYPMNGSIDEIGIWNRRLNAGEVDYIYNLGSGKTYPF